MNQIQAKIIKIFLYKNSVPFNVLKKEIEILSNKLSYHLSKLKEKNIVEKIGNRYTLDESYKEFFPYLEIIIDKQKCPIIIVKAIITRENKHFLVCRNKEPFHSFWELPTTKLKLGEKIEDAGRRILKNLGIISNNIKKDLEVRELIISKDKIIFDYLIYFLKINLKDEKVNTTNLFSKNYLDEVKLIPTDNLYLHSKLKNNELIKLNYSSGDLTLL